MGHAIGALLAGAPVVLAGAYEMEGADPHRAVMLACAAAGLAMFALYALLGRSIDAGTVARPRLSPRSRAIVTKISALFALDSLGGGFLTTALLSYFFFEQFGVREDEMALLFAGARALNALSHLGAAYLAKRIGLVN